MKDSTTRLTDLPSRAIGDNGYTDRQSQLLAAIICCLVLPTLVVGLRLLARLTMKVTLWWDDYCAFAALVRLW
jgi:hypothetical protein